MDWDWLVGLARVLGNQMADELGHLPLGSNENTRQGTMFPSWKRVNSIAREGEKRSVQIAMGVRKWATPWFLVQRSR
jgi:hypothetical protein